MGRKFSVGPPLVLIAFWAITFAPAIVGDPGTVVDDSCVAHAPATCEFQCYVGDFHLEVWGAEVNGDGGFARCSDALAECNIEYPKTKCDDAADSPAYIVGTCGAHGLSATAFCHVG